ncbi:MAG: hypothetical protein RL518_195 [Pseudomonadota bacterium]
MKEVDKNSKKQSDPRSPDATVQDSLVLPKADSLGLANAESVEIRGSTVTNYSSIGTSQIYQWLPHGLEASEIVFLPDVCPSRGPLPTGCSVRTTSPDWRRLALSDVGCGMQLLESTRSFDDFRESDWDALGRSLLKYKGGLGDLGGGNHFLDAIVSYKTGRLFFLVHTGSRLESGLLDDFVDQPATFDREYKRITGWARDNRDTIADVIRKHFGLCNLVLDLPHNTFEIEDDGAVTIRKGAVKTDPGVLSILPSSMTGDVALVRASEQVASSLHSVSHGTGRTMSRGDARNRISPTETAEIRNQVYIPEYIVDASLRTESTRCYRALDDCLDLLGPLVNVEERFGVIAYLGHLG